MDYQHIVSGTIISRWAYQKLSYTEQQQYRPYHSTGFNGTPNYDNTPSSIPASDIPAMDEDPVTAQESDQQ